MVCHRMEEFGLNDDISEMSFVYHSISWLKTTCKLFEIMR